ncbi:MAG: carboxypeptidase-like regulatory domain-containing protein [Thermoplasmatota archaeon]
MRWFVVLMLCVLALAAPLSALSVHEDRGGKVWAGPDLGVEINVPENGGRYQKEKGLSVNATVKNHGEDMAQIGANISMKIKTLEDGIVIHSTIPRPFSGLGSGENETFEFPNWTGITVGRFICNVTVAYPDDVNMTNNYAEHTFSVWTDYFPYPPKFRTGSISSLKGDLDTVFEYRVEYKFNELPDAIKVEIDGQNHTMVEEDPLDDIAEDGKFYTYNTTLSIGNHRYRFFGEVSGQDLFASPYNMSRYYTGPWVNISLRDEMISPYKGYITTEFLFKVNYGSISNLPPDRIYVTLNGKVHNLSRSSPTPNYLSGDVEFKTRVLGMEIIPSPFTYSFNVETGPDSYSIGPFNADGPSMERVDLGGRVTDLKGYPLEDVEVALDPGTSTLTDGSGSYSIESYVGNGFQLKFSKDGFISRSYEINLMDDRNFSTELESLPVGGTVKGTVRSDIGTDPHLLEEVEVNLTGPSYSSEYITEEDGSYIFANVPAGTGYSLTFSEIRHRTRTIQLDVGEEETVTINVTLIEKDLEISASPDPVDDAVEVDQHFEISFSSIPDTSTVEVHFENGTGSVPAEVQGSENSTMVEVWPSKDLNFHEEYDMILLGGILNRSGSCILWRNLTWSVLTEMPPQGEPYLSLDPDSEDVPLDAVIELSFGIGIDHSTFNCSIYNMDVISGALEYDLEFRDFVNWSDSGRTDTVIRIDPMNLTFRTRYSVEVSSSLQDIYGRYILSSPMEFSFSTEREPDSDGDGVPDSGDAFPEDPTEWKDSDGDGVGDNSDAFPFDPDEWLDTDGDGVGDNEDDDADGDGMPDQWELEHGLDPRDPSDAFIDGDGDGYYNIEEYLAGTDPNDKESSPEDGGDGPTSILIIIAAVVLLVVVAIIGSLFLLGKIGQGRGTGPAAGPDPFQEE